MTRLTFNLPDDLVERLEQRAVRDGRTPEQVAADVLAAGLSPGNPVEAVASGTPLVSRNLPRIAADPATTPDAAHARGQTWTDALKDAEQELEVERYEKAFGHQRVDSAHG